MDTQSIGSISAAPAATQTTARSTVATEIAPRANAPGSKRAQAVPNEADVQSIPKRDPRSLQYQVDGGTNRIVATIIDDGSRTVVRQIPDAELLRIAQAIDRMQGFLVEEQA